MKKLSNQHGFLLIEFLISFIIFTGLMSALAQYQWNIHKWQQESKQRLFAAHEAQAVLEQIRATHKPLSLENNGVQVVGSLTPCAPLRGRAHDGLTHEWRMTTSRFRVIEVQATWQSVSGQQRSYKLISGCVV